MSWNSGNKISQNLLSALRSACEQIEITTGGTLEFWIGSFQIGLKAYLRARLKELAKEIESLSATLEESKAIANDPDQRAMCQIDDLYRFCFESVLWHQFNVLDQCFEKWEELRDELEFWES
jgi:hypothetical protein